MAVSAIITASREVHRLRGMLLTDDRAEDLVAHRLQRNVYPAGQVSSAGQHEGLQKPQLRRTGNALQLLLRGERLSATVDLVSKRKEGRRTYVVDDELRHELGKAEELNEARQGLDAERVRRAVLLVQQRIHRPPKKPQNACQRAVSW